MLWAETIHFPNRLSTQPTCLLHIRRKNSIREMPLRTPCPSSQRIDSRGHLPKGRDWRILGKRALSVATFALRALWILARVDIALRILLIMRIPSGAGVANSYWASSGLFASLLPGRGVGFAIYRF